MYMLCAVCCPEVHIPWYQAHFLCSTSAACASRMTFNDHCFLIQVNLDTVNVCRRVWSVIHKYNGPLKHFHFFVAFLKWTHVYSILSARNHRPFSFKRVSTSQPVDVWRKGSPLIFSWPSLNYKPWTSIQRIFTPVTKTIHSFARKISEWQGHMYSNNNNFCASSFYHELRMV